MAWRKKYYKSKYRRRYYRRRSKRTYRRRNRRLYRKRSNVHHFRRSAAVAVISTPTTDPEFNGASTFRLTDVFGNTEFTSLFEYYRLNCVVLRFIPDFNLFTQSTGGSSLGQAVPQLHVAWDYSNGTNADVTELVQYESYKTMRFNRTYTFKVYPRTSTEIYQSAASTSYGLGRKNMWLHADNPSIPHYGFKFAVDNYNQSGGQAVNFKIRPFYYFSLKHVK